MEETYISQGPNASRGGDLRKHGVNASTKENDANNIHNRCEDRDVNLTEGTPCRLWDATN